MERIYLDHAATTRPDRRVLEAMLHAYEVAWGNPSSIYAEGQRARALLDGARKQVTQVLDCRPNEVIFTSGGSEADNAAIRGAAYAQRGRGHHIVTTRIEHDAVLHAVEQLEREGFTATYLPVDGEGFVDLGALEAAVTEETTVVSIMYANNEVGTIEPIEEATRIVKAKNPAAVFHTDAVQAAGALDIRPRALGVDMLSLAGHKIYGPKGVGVLYVKGRTPFQPFVVGGGQEKNRRAGTENVAGAVGMAEALRMAYEELEERTARVRRLRDRLFHGLPDRIPDTVITGPRDLARRLPNNFSCCFGGVQGETVLLQMDLDGMAASSGSACTTGSLEPSHVLVAMGTDEELARSSLRLTLGVDNTDEHVDHVLEALPAMIARLRAMSGTVSANC
jgi:cysteine desulfurase